MSTNPAHVAAQQAVAAGTATPPAMQALQDQLAAALQLIADQAAKLEALEPKSPVPGVEVLYYSSAPFMRVPIMRAPGQCDDVQFAGGKLQTSDLAVIQVLDKMCAVKGTGVSRAPVEVEPEVAVMRADLTAMAEKSHAKMLAAGERTA